MKKNGFSLVEVLVAIAILGVGLIMVASIFPVAATWTRQASEETVASQVALNAVNIIKVKLSSNAFSWQSDTTYPAGALTIYNGHVFKAGSLITSGGSAPTPTSPGSWIEQTSTNATTIATICDYMTPYSNAWAGGNIYAVNDKVVHAGRVYRALQAQSTPPHTPVAGGDAYWSDEGAYPGAMFPISERAYAFGSDQPYPANTPANAMYFWTAIIRPTGIGSEINLYVCVFRKGAVEQTFTLFGGTEVSGIRGSGETNVPVMVYEPYAHGSLDTATNKIINNTPPIGVIGIGMDSGTVFRQGFNANATQADPNVRLSSATEPVIYAPAADNTDPSASPLVYVYQTKLSF